jgi:AraC-like DNA-binding protein
MDAIYEGRSSDSPYIDKVWRGRALRDHLPLCPADVRWNLLFIKRNDVVTVLAEGATTQSVLKSQTAGTEFLVIKFTLGNYMPYLPAANLLNGNALLPEAAGKTFWMNSEAWEFPDYDNVETFVDWMVRDGALVTDPVVTAALQDEPLDLSSRTVRRRFLFTTGLTQNAIQQIERAKHAVNLLEQGLSILDTVYEAGYADQPHLTRALRRFIGQTPAQISRVMAANP